MRVVIELIAAVFVLAVVGSVCFGFGARSMENKDFGCVSYSHGAATRAIDVLLPHLGEADPVNWYGQ